MFDSKVLKNTYDGVGVEQLVPRYSRDSENDSQSNLPRLHCVFSLWAL